MQDQTSKLKVEVAYVKSGAEYIIPVLIMPGATIREVIEKSDLLTRCPEIDLARNRVGVFSCLRELDELVCEGDRVEIYRELKVDPKEARRRRALKQKDKR